MSLELVIDSFVDKDEEDLSLGLMKTLAYPEQGGLGYSVRLFNPVVDLDGWEVDHSARVIYLDERVCCRRLRQPDSRKLCETHSRLRFSRRVLSSSYRVSTSRSPECAPLVQRDPCAGRDGAGV